MPLIALQIAESQIAFITNWLTMKPGIAAPVIADSLIAMTRADLRALLNLPTHAAILIPGEKLRVVYPGN